MFYTQIARPILFRVDPELAHRLAIRTGHRLSCSPLARRVLRRVYNVQFPELQVSAFGIRFANPVGLSAGFDKHAHVYPVIADIGFGHMEIGSVSARVWPGNPSPTLLRLPKDWGLINWLGLNSEGAAAVQARLRGSRFEIPTGINLVKTADPHISGPAAVDDYFQGFQQFYDVADFITLNLSCPNTCEGQTFQDPELLVPFLRRIREHAGRLPAGRKEKAVLIKLSPDLSDPALDALLAVAREFAVSGCVIGNTTVHRETLKTPRSVLDAFGPGGVSGRPLKPYVQEMVRKIHRRTEGCFPIVACGGVGCDPDMHPAEEVWEYLKMGATLVQLHTGLIYRGPGIARMINEKLVEILKRNKLSNLSTSIWER